MLATTRFALSLLLGALCLPEFASAQGHDMNGSDAVVEKPAYLKRAAGYPSERLALLKLCAQFQQAIREKDGRLLASL